jgi:hypothetical protein
MGFLQPFQADFHQIMGDLQYELRGLDPVKQRKPGGAGARSAGHAPSRPRRPPSDPHLLTGGSK